MQVVKSAGAMQRLAARWRRAGTPVAFVPTMGCLHEGHLSLAQRARKAVGRGGKVVVSIYVNPAQFAPGEDFSRYPRTFDDDRRLCARAGTDVVFAPADREMYPSGHSTYVSEEKLSRSMEGQSRPTHFRGVTTVVAKLFNIVQPDIAVFGAKDFQQAAVIRRMVRDLNFTVRILVSPTVREKDGLAMSSRNRYLDGPLRLQARALNQAIAKAREILRKEKTVDAGSLRAQLRGIIEQQPATRIDYIEFFDPATLEKTEAVSKDSRLALAVFVGATRLIDNAALDGKGP